MTKDQLQKELKEKVKEGVKPSHLRKLKRSKSANDIPSAPPSPTTQIKSLEDKISVLELKIETQDRDLEALETENKELKKNPPTPLLQDQLKAKQTQIEDLRKQLELTHQKLTQSNAELDTSLQARHNSLSDWWTQYSKNKALDEELTENIEQASEELINQDKELVDLRSQVQKLKLTNQSLQKDLNLSQRVNELRSNSWPDNSPANTYSKYALYTLVAIWFISLLNSSWKIKNYE